MKQRKTIWILVPMMSKESKKTFEDFVKSKTGKVFKVPEQYKDGLVMLLVSPDLESFSLTNISCARSADFTSGGVGDFIANYDDFKRRYDSAVSNIDNDFQEAIDNLSFHQKERRNHYSLIMPDGNMIGVWTYKGEDDAKQLEAFMDNWFEVTSKDPIMYGHKVISTRARVCPKCGGELHFVDKDKTRLVWCTKCHERHVEEKK